MKISRRHLLATAGAGLIVPGHALATPPVLRAGPVTAQILPPGDGTTELWGFNGSTPGPELRLRQGEDLSIRFENATPEGSAIHWHGIRIANAMDGVPNMTQELVEPGAAFDYRFTLPDAGTYWYHSHHRSWEQVARGLYGPLIVEEQTPPDVDHDITVILDDWRIERTGALIEDFGSLRDFSHAGRLGTFARVFTSVDRVQRGARVRVRLINAATARVFPLEVTGLNGKVVALDGFPLETLQDIAPAMIAPAQRMDLIGDVTGQIDFTFQTRGAPYALGEIAIAGEVTPRSEPVAALPPARVTAPAARPEQRLTMRLEGGAMGGAHEGDDIWALDGQSHLPAAPWAVFQRGETAQITFVNDTAFPHAMHLHGHHFHEMRDGVAGPLRDTTLLMRGQSRDILCVFDNPGTWLLHCHMLGHQASGMKTRIEVR